MNYQDPATLRVTIKALRDRVATTEDLEAKRILAAMADDLEADLHEQEEDDVGL